MSPPHTPSSISSGAETSPSGSRGSAARFWSRVMSDSVSVVLATYNTARFLRAAIESVLEQTHRNLELIIVDDGSTDGTRDIVETFLADPRVRYVYQANAGQPAADNLGISKAAGPFIAFID